MAITRLGGANAITGTIPQGNIANASLGAISALPAGVGGKVLQVKQTVKTDVFSSTSTSAVDVTGLSVSITPASSSNKIYVYLSTYVGHSNSDEVVALYLYRDSTLLYRGDANGSMSRVSGGIHTTHGTTQQNETFYSGISYLDSPSSSSSLTYKIQGNTILGTFFVNKAGSTYTGVERTAHSSSITVWEIAG